MARLRHYFSPEKALLSSLLAEEKPLEETVSEIRNVHENAVFVVGDITKADNAQNMVRKTTETFGRLDILVNNAGVNYKPDTTNATKEEAQDVTVDTDLKGIYLVSKYAIPELSKMGFHYQYFFHCGDERLPGAIAYTTSKGGVINMTRSMALN